MKSNNKFNTELYNWKFKKLNNKHYQWKRNNFKIETTYYKEKIKLKLWCSHLVKFYTKPVKKLFQIQQ